MKTVHVSILGCCSTRDSIEVFKNSQDICDDVDIVVDKYINNLSILSVFAKPFSEEDYDLATKEAALSSATRFQHRKLDQEMRKNHFDFLKEAQSEYFIIDTSAVRLPVFKVGESYISCESIWQIVKDIPDYKDKDFFLKRIMISDKTSPCDLDRDELKDLYCRYLDKLLELYEQKQIVFINLKNASAFIGKDGNVDQELALRKSTEQEDAMMEFAFEIAKEHCPKSTFIEELPITIGDLDHWFGLHPLHYVNDVYRYYAESLLPFVKGKGKKEVECESKQLKEAYTLRLFSILCDAANRYALRKTNLLDETKYPKPGMCALNGVSLKTYADLSFEIEGEAFDETSFYLYSKTGNPIGDWSLAPTDIGPGKYMLKTGFNSDSLCHIDVVLFNDTTDKKWIWGNKSVEVTLEHGYKFILARAVVTKGAKIDRSGLITLEKID